MAPEAVADLDTPPAPVDTPSASPPTPEMEMEASSSPSPEKQEQMPSVQKLSAELELQEALLAPAALEGSEIHHKNEGSPGEHVAEPVTEETAASTALEVLKRLCHQGRPDKVREFLADPTKAKLPDPRAAAQQALVFIASSPDPRKVEVARALLEAGASVADGANEANTNTALYNACENGSATMVRFLLKQGANPNETVEQGMTPLIAASMLDRGSDDKLTALLDAGADVRHQIMDANQENPLTSGWTALMAASYKGNLTVATLLLKSLAEHEDRATLKLLEAKNSSGETARDLAIKSGSRLVAMFLKKAKQKAREAAKKIENPQESSLAKAALAEAAATNVKAAAEPATPVQPAASKCKATSPECHDPRDLEDLVADIENNEKSSIKVKKAEGKAEAKILKAEAPPPQAAEHTRATPVKEAKEAEAKEATAPMPAAEPTMATSMKEGGEIDEEDEDDEDEEEPSEEEMSPVVQTTEATLSRSASQSELQSSSVPSAEAALRSCAPDCSADVFQKLLKEAVTTAADLAALDEEDLRDLGLNEAERARVLRWAREEFNGDGDGDATEAA